MDWIYLSAHLDDAVYSCGGLIWEQVCAGENVAVWTVCAGDPPHGLLSSFAKSLHARWGVGREAASLRREEDRLACGLVGADYRHLSIPDCIYRRSPLDGTALYEGEAEIFGALHPLEARLIEDFSQELAEALPEKTRLVSPLGLGGHVDHQLARAAAEMSGLPLCYYADYPYVLERGIELEAATAGMQSTTLLISPEGLQAWEAGIAAYASQVSTFWADMDGMRARLRSYQQQVGGARMWRAFS